MSMTLEVRGRTSGTWPLSTSCIGQIERLRRTDAKCDFDTIFGDEATQAGTARTIDRVVLLQAIKATLPLAKKLPGGFEVYVPPHGGLLAIKGPGVGGVLIGERYYYIRCWDDYWTMQSPEEMRGDKEPARHYEPAEIQTQNMGVVNVQPKKSSRSDLAKLLRGVEKFVDRDTSCEVTLTWG